MRLTHSILAAALAASVAAPAAAKIDDSFSVDGELFWSIVDETAERSYTRDLGIGLQEFLNGVATGQTWSFANDANLTTFLAETASGNALVWNIGALDGTGINRYLSTAVPGSTLPVFSNQILGFFNDNPDIYLGASNAIKSHISDENDNPIADGSHIATAADGPAYAGAATWGGNFGGRAQGFSNYIGASDPAALVLFEQNSSAFAQRFNPGKTTALQYAGNPYAASFDGSKLTIAAIPEPSTYAMLGLGLAAIGFAARRRAAK